MERKAVSGIMLTLLLVCTSTLASNIQPVEASGPIYIRADGSIDPPTAPIQRNGDLYALTGDVTSDTDGIFIERDNMTLDGADYSLQGTGTGFTKGISLSGRSNITIKTVEVKGFSYGIYLDQSSNNTMSGNNITSNEEGISVFYSSNNNTLSGNNIAANSWGIHLNDSSNNNSIYGNNITINDMEGIWLDQSSNNNSIYGNDIGANAWSGIKLVWSINNKIYANNITANLWAILLSRSSDNRIFKNNLIDNTDQVNVDTWSLNVWDDGYPSGGNYWSDYAGVDNNSDGIGDTPYIIDVDNKDRYPLMTPWTPHNIAVINVAPFKTVVGQGFTVQTNVAIVNRGDYNETFNVTVYATETIIATLANTTLAIGHSTTITITWNTSGFVKGNYTISAYATLVPGETDVTDNTFIDGWVIVAMVGDITGPTGWPEGKCDIRDIAFSAKYFGKNVPPAPANYDITGLIRGVPDGKIDMRDIATIAKEFGKVDP